jgi:hypothetical protein
MTGGTSVLPRTVSVFDEDLAVHESFPTRAKEHLSIAARNDRGSL